MAKIHLITGGQRSGKSSYAQTEALKISNKPTYLATSRKWDEDHAARINRHIEDRADKWHTIEEEKYIGQLHLHKEVVVLDCITLWLTNFFSDEDNNVDKCLDLAKKEISLLQKQNTTIYIITNEIGMGGHGATDIQRKFTDLQGWVNQYIASIANEVTLMVSGLPLKVK